MGKYGTMRDKKTGGVSQWILSETSTEHDETAEHPYMLSIFQKRMDYPAYLHYLKQNKTIFDAINLRMAELQQTDGALKTLNDDTLDRSAGLDADISQFAAGLGSPATLASPATDAYLAAMADDEAELGAAGLAVHHMLQYMAVLSGGSFIKGCITKTLQKMPLPTETHDSAGSKVDFYKFDGLKASEQPQFVQAYLDRFDRVFADLGDVERMQLGVAAKRVYALMLGLMNECYDLNPVELEAPKAAPAAVAAGDAMDLTLAELAKYTGEDGTKILISIRAKLYDVSSGSAHYGVGGGYSFFAGHDVTRCLATMTLKRECLDDLSYTTDGDDKAERVLADWEKKLSAKYPVCGGLHGGAAAAATTTTATTASAGKAAAAAGGDTCPFSGAAATDGASCPAGFSGTKPAATDEPKGECPWPFIFLHDIRGGLKQEHLAKNLALVAVVAGIAYKLLM